MQIWFSNITFKLEFIQREIYIDQTDGEQNVWSRRRQTALHQALLLIPLILVIDIRIFTN
jgi:hypothetical protein